MRRKSIHHMTMQM